MAQTRTTRPDPRAAGTFTLTARWAAAILTVLVLLFFHEVALEGRTFISPDAVAPAGFVRMGEQSLWGERVYPLWNPYVFLGMPSFGSGAYNPLIYPPDWPLGLVQKFLPFLPDMTWLLLYYVLGGLFMFLLAREWGARAEGALLAGVAFVFQPNLVAVGSHGHGSQLVNSAYLPLMLWLAVRWLRRGQPLDLGLLALAGGFQFLRGHLQICFYTWLAVGLWTLVSLAAVVRQPGELPRQLLRAAGIGLAAALAFGLAGLYNLPLKDYAQYSIRGGSDGGGTGFAYATGWSLAPYELPATVLPSFVGFGGQTYWGGMPFTDYPNTYLGIVAVLLALPALLAGGAARAYALALAAIALLIAFGSHTPVYQWLYAHAPFFNRFRIPVMIVILLQLAAALALAWGWTAVLDRPPAARPREAAKPGPLERLLLAAGGACALGLLVATLGRGALESWYVSFATSVRTGFPPEAARAAFGPFAGDLALVSLLGAITAGLAWFAARRALPATAATAIALLLLLANTWPVSSRVMQGTVGDRVANPLDVGRDDVVEFLEKAAPVGSFRVMPVAEFQSNRFAGFGIASVGGYHAAKPRLFQDLMDREAIQDPRWWALLNVQYLVLPQALPPEQTPPFLSLVHSGTAAVYAFAAGLPRATVVGAYGVLPDTGRAAIDSVRAGVRDPSAFTWLTRDPGVALGPVAGASASIRRYALHEVVVDVDTPGPGLLRLADLWYPDWQATVDGKPVEILRADHLLRAVVVPAGRHEVVFRFTSPAWRQGLRLSLASLAAVLGLIGLGLWRRRRPRTETAPA